jgi:hypothetical protein
MRFGSSLWVLGVVLALGAGAGCSGRKPQTQPQSHPAAASKNGKPAPKVVLAAEKAGKVIKVNATARFIVVNFPVGTLPAQGTTLGVFRDGLKTAEAKITGPQLDDNIVADLISGEAQVGDEVRQP